MGGQVPYLSPFILPPLSLGAPSDPGQYEFYELGLAHYQVTATLPSPAGPSCYHHGHSPHLLPPSPPLPSPPLAAALDASQVYMYSDDLENPVSVTDPYYALDPWHGPAPDTGHPDHSDHPDHWAATAASGSPSGTAPATGTRLFDRTHKPVHGGSVPGADLARRALEASTHGSVDGGRSVMSFLSPSRHGALRRPSSKVHLCSLDRPLFRPRIGPYLVYSLGPYVA